MAKNKGGRPTKITELVVNKLEEAFMLDCTDAEACLNAGISRTALHNYQKKNPKFVDRKALLKESMFLKARKALQAGIQDDPVLALKYMERKKKDEFSLKQEVEMSGDMEITVKRETE